MRNTVLTQKSFRKMEAFMPEESGISDRSSMWDIVSLDEAVDTDDPSKREGGTHLKYGKLNAQNQVTLTALRL